MKRRGTVAQQDSVTVSQRLKDFEKDLLGSQNAFYHQRDDHIGRL